MSWPRSANTHQSLERGLRVLEATASMGGSATLSEIALALKAGRPVVLLDFPLGVPFGAAYERGQLVDAASPNEAMAAVRAFLTSKEYA